MNKPADADTDFIDFEDNRMMTELCGGADEHLVRIENALDVALTPRGNRIAITGSDWAREATKRALQDLYRRLKEGLNVAGAEVDAAVRLASTSEAGPEWSGEDEFQIKTPKRAISPRTPTQASYIEALQRDDLVFGVGPAGTGKTYLAVAAAVAAITQGSVERIVLSRPALEAGERIGFLPGDMREKIDPYLRPLYDALHDTLPSDKVEKKIASGEIEIAPLAFMRGRTLARAYVILDEGQNASPQQMKMFLTRLGEGARMVVTGDPTQSDLPRGVRSGLTDALETLEGLTGLSVTRFSEKDVIRHPLVMRIAEAYSKRDTARKGDGARSGPNEPIHD